MQGRAVSGRVFNAVRSGLNRMSITSRVVLRDWGVVYVFHGPEERALGGFDPTAAPYLRRVYASGGVAIYRVALEGQP